MTETSSFIELSFIDDGTQFDDNYIDSLKTFHENEIVTGKVVGIDSECVTVDIGYKSEGIINVNEFYDKNRQLTVSEGDEVEVFIDSFENYSGMVVLSKEKARQLRTWEKIERIYEEDGVVEGELSSRIKGGLIVDIGVRAFLPGSQIGLRPIRDLDALIGEVHEFKILKLDRKRGNVVLSRRALLEVGREQQRDKLLEELEEGITVKGYVKNITDYGVFVDLGGLDGLLHITDISWGRLMHPSDLFEVGDELETIVLKYEPETQKVSLGYKQKFSNPWESVEEKHPIGTAIKGKVVTVMDYGIFVEVEPGVEGLVHISEVFWTKSTKHPSKIFNVGDYVEAIVKEIDIKKKRIALSIRDTQPNPWHKAKTAYPVGSVIKGKVRNIAEFGIFVGLAEGIDGLVHISDISWKPRDRKPSAFAEKNSEIEVKVLGIDADKERISLGIKQLTRDPWEDIQSNFSIGEAIEGEVVNVTDFGIFIEISDGVEGLIHASDLPDEIGKGNLGKFYAVGSKLKVKIDSIDSEDRRLALLPYDDTADSYTAPKTEKTQNRAFENAFSGLMERQGLAKSAESEADAESEVAAESKADVDADTDAETAKTDDTSSEDEQ